MIKIIKLADEITNSFKQDILLQVKTIFYLSSSLKEFSSPERKEAFFKRWCGDYITYFSDFFYIMLEDQKVLGYLSGCIDSVKGQGILEVPGYCVYSDLFAEYPAHLHINFHPDSRGRGLGSLLVNEYCKDLSVLKIKGVHLVTSPGAANISFYERLGFTYEVERNFNQMNLLFMGKILE